MSQHNTQNSEQVRHCRPVIAKCKTVQRWQHPSENGCVKYSTSG